MDYERLFLDNLGLVDQVVRGIARRHRLSADEAEELGLDIRVKLIDHDYAVLRRFENRSSLRTYLTTVVNSFFLDGRNARWGKWRPSVDARRRGPTAVLLERLLTRDGLTFDEAVEMLRASHDIQTPIAELHAMSLSFPRRSRRRFVGDDELEGVAGPAGTHEPTFEAEAARVSAVGRALLSALAGLEPRDRLLLKMRFRDGFKVSEIATLLDVAAKPLYARLQQLFVGLRLELEAHGVSREDVETLMEMTLELEPVLEGDE